MSNGELPPITEEAGQPIVQELATLVSLLRLLVEPIEPEVARPDKFTYPQDLANNTFKGVYWAIKDIGVPGAWAYIPALIVGGFFVALGAVGSLLLYLFKVLAPPIAEFAVGFIDEARKLIDSPVAQIAVLTLNELLGTEFTGALLSTDIGVEAHIQRAEQVGGLLHDQLIGEFRSEGDVTPEGGRRAARKFSGLLVNFGVATGMISLLGELGSLGRFEQFRELGVEVARNLGLGRLHRMVMRPVIEILIDQPYKWWLNQRFHPTQLPFSMLVNPFTQAVMPRDQIFAALDREGFSQDKIEEFIKLHQKRFSLDEVETLVRWGFWSSDVGEKYVANLGWPEELVKTALSLQSLKRIDARILKLVDALEANVEAGHMTVEEFEALVKTFPIGEDERAIMLAIVKAKAKAPHRSLTVAEIQQAFEQGLLTLDELDARLVQLGFTSSDEQILAALTLLKLGKIEDAKKKAAAKHAAATTKAKAKGQPPPPAPPIVSPP